MAAPDLYQSCRVCGCTDDDGCPGGCTWVEDDLCSECTGAAGVTKTIAKRARLLLVRAEREAIASRLSIAKWLDLPGVSIRAVAHELHCSPRTLHQCAAVYHAFAANDIAAWTDLRDRSGACLSWSHLVVLSTVRPKRNVNALLVEWANARTSLTVRQLAHLARSRKERRAR